MEIDDNDFKQLLGLLQQLVQKTASDQSVSNDSANSDEDDTDEVAIERTRRKKVSDSDAKPKKKKKFVNKFLKMKEASMHKDDTAIDKKLSKLPPTQRSRSFEYVKVKCRVCGKEEKVIPALAEARDRYKCNRCSTSPG